jgi:hypothetical protein
VRPCFKKKKERKEGRKEGKKERNGSKEECTFQKMVPFCPFSINHNLLYLSVSYCHFEIPEAKYLIKKRGILAYSSGAPSWLWQGLMRISLQC